MDVSKAVIPAAGFGTRFLPVTKAQPKEMMPVLDKPTIQYVVENIEMAIKQNDSETNVAVKRLLERQKE